MSRSVLACAGAAALLAAFAVVGQRVGLALTAVLLLVIAAAWRAARPAGRLALAAAVGLALMPVLRDAGWVVAVCVAATAVAAGAAVVRPATWTQFARTVTAPLAWPGGARLLATTAWQALPRPIDLGSGAAALRGSALAAALLALFGALFVTADSAFADLTGDLLSAPSDPLELAARVAVAALVLFVVAALAWSARPAALGPRRRPWAPGRVELVIALSALVGLFALFVAVQMRVLFGGADYVQRTTGLGYGDYARQGFVQLLVVAALTLSVVAIAARRPDPRVRMLLAALCGLTVVVLVSAFARLGLVTDAYGLTRVRYGGGAVLVWLALMFALVLAAGARASIARLAPRVAVAATLGLVLAFALSDPDARIAGAAVDRYAQDGVIDRAYLSSLSADAIVALRRLPAGERRAILPALLDRLRRPDGVAGFNLARARAR